MFTPLTVQFGRPWSYLVIAIPLVLVLVARLDASVGRSMR
jgi:hypothetical protein